MLCCSCPTSPLLPVQHWALGRYKQAATVMDKKITASVRVDYSFFSPDRKEMSLHTSLRLLRAATTFIRQCWSPGTPQPEMHLVGNASTWAEAFKVIRADGGRAARSSVSGKKVVLLPPEKHGLSLQAAKGRESLEKPQVTGGKVTLPRAACVPSP